MEEDKEQVAAHHGVGEPDRCVHLAHLFCACRALAECVLVTNCFVAMGNPRTRRALRPAHFWLGC